MRIHITLFLFLCGLLSVKAQEKSFTKTFELDSVTLLRNPAMGWMLYEEGASFEPKSKNYDPVIFWEEMDEAVKGLLIHWRHVKGHAGNKYNDLCDALAVEASHII